MPRYERTISGGNPGKLLASLLLAGSLALGLSAQARADHRGSSFREFKIENSGLANRTLRQMYRDDFGSHSRRTDSVAPVNAALSAFSSSAPGRSDKQLPQFHRQTVQLQDSGLTVRTRNGVDLNLDSSSRNITLGEKLFGTVAAVTIDRGGEDVTLSAGSQVTPAEYVAVKQVLIGGSQSVTLDGSGRAIGGGVDLSQITARNDRMRADDLTVPVNVTAYGDFSKNSTFQVLGDLVNAGSIYAETSRHGGSAGSISSNSLRNEVTGLITSIPKSGDDVVDLTLHADDSINNLGTISSSGNLTLSAGNSVSNLSAGTTQAHISAQKNVEIAAPLIVNNGSIDSNTADITLNSQGALTVDNRNGTVRALSGSINIRDHNFHESFDTYVVGGDLISKELNVNTGLGTADINVNKLTGVLNQTGLASHVTAETEVLALGNICLDGDPTYKNSAGSIAIVGNITVGEALTLIADGDITNSVPVVITAGTSASGFNVTMIAGANITSGGTDTTSVGPIPPVQSGNTATTISGTAGNGGSISLGSNELIPVTISTKPTSGSNNNGGDVLLAAYDNAGVGGRIDLSFTTINTGGRGSGNNGNVTIIAGGLPSGATITVGAIDTTGGSGTGGDISISSFTPQSSGGSITYDQFGARTSVAQIVPSATSALSPHILFKNSIVAAGNVTIKGGLDGNISIDDFDITTKAKNGVVDITASGLGNITCSGFTIITANVLHLTAGTGDIGDVPNNIPIFTNATTITANGDNSSTDVLLQTFTPGLNVFSGTAASMNVATQGTIITDPSQGPITADTLLIGSFSGSAGLNALHPLEVDATFLFVAGLGGNVFVHNSNAGQTNLAGGQSLQAAGTLSITSDGTIGLALGEKIVAKNVILQPASEFINLAGSISANTSVSLISNLALDPANVTASITTPLLNVTSLTQTVGLSSLNAFQPSPGVGAVAAFAPNGSVWLQGSATAKAGLAGGFANGLFDYRGTGSTTISGNITTTSATGDINVIINGAGTLAVNSDVVLTASKNLNLLITDLNSTKQKITFGKSSSLQTLNGSILVSVGTPSGPVAGTPPAKGVGFVEVGGGQIFWGDFGITGKGTNSVFAKGADVQFTNTIKANAITLSGGVAIVADP